MARGFSKVILIGNLTRDPETRTTPTGHTVCTFSLAVNRTFRDTTGEQKETVSFIDCSAWGKGGEIISQYMKKGRGLMVCGRLEQRSWEDKTTGQKRSRVEVVVEDFNFLGNGADGQTGGGATYGGASNNMPAAEAPEVVPTDIPDEPIDLNEIPF